MKNSLQKKTHLFIILTFMFYASFSFAKGVASSSMLISASIPLVGVAYTLTSSDYEGFKELGIECLLTAQIVTLLKNSVKRERPNGENNMSFPSGHTAAGFVGASFLHHRYGLNWGLPFYGLAAAIGVQRVNVKDHYWTDVLAGAAIGYAAGALLTAKYPKVWVAPTFEPESNTFGLQIKTFFD